MEFAEDCSTLFYYTITGIFPDLRYNDMDAMSLLGNDHLPLVIGALRLRSTLFEERPGGLEGYLQ